MLTWTPVRHIHSVWHQTSHHTVCSLWTWWATDITHFSNSELFYFSLVTLSCMPFLPSLFFHVELWILNFTEAGLQPWKLHFGIYSLRLSDCKFYNGSSRDILLENNLSFKEKIRLGKQRNMKDLWWGTACFKCCGALMLEHSNIPSQRDCWW